MAVRHREALMASYDEAGANVPPRPFADPLLARRVHELRDRPRAALWPALENC